MQCIVEIVYIMGGHRHLEVLVEMARRLRLDAEVGAARPEGGEDPGQHLVGVGLVVHGVEAGDEVEASLLAELGRVACDELDVVGPLASALGPAPLQGRLGDVETGEPRGGELGGEQVERPGPLPQPTSATSIPARQRPGRRAGAARPG